MRILYVAPNIPVPGTHGGSTHVTEVVRVLRALGHEVLLLARWGSSGPGVVGMGGPSLPGPLRYALPLVHLPMALRAARAFKPDAIYERFSAYGLGVLLGKLLGVPVLSMVLDKQATWITLAGADRLISTAPRLIDTRYHGKLEKVFWGANIEMFHPEVSGAALRHRLGVGPDELLYGYTGALYPWHGLEDLVDAAHLLERDERAQNVRYLILGSGALEEPLRERVARLGLEHRFIMVPRVPYAEVPEYVAACDVCVAPYNPDRHPHFRKHGMFLDPLKVFEYLAAGKPTITFDSKNMRALFDGDRHLVLHGPGDVVGIAAAIVRLATRPDLRAQLAAEGRDHVLENYSWRAHGEHLTRMFEQLRT